jgi:hypothetical protein
MVEFDYKRKVQFGERVCDMPPVGQGGEDRPAVRPVRRGKDAVAAPISQSI